MAALPSSTTVTDRLIACSPCFETLAWLAPPAITAKPLRGHEVVVFQQVRPPLMGTRAGVSRLIRGKRFRRPLSHDPKIAIGRISALFPKGESENRQAPQSRHLQIARGRGKARARRAVFQAALGANSANGCFAGHNGQRIA